ATCQKEFLGAASNQSSSGHSSIVWRSIASPAWYWLLSTERIRPTCTTPSVSSASTRVPSDMAAAGYSQRAAASPSRLELYLDERDHEQERDLAPHDPVRVAESLQDQGGQGDEQGSDELRLDTARLDAAPGRVLLDDQDAGEQERHVCDQESDRGRGSDRKQGRGQPREGREERERCQHGDAATQVARRRGHGDELRRQTRADQRRCRPRRQEAGDQHGQRTAEAPTQHRGTGRRADSSRPTDDLARRE